VVGEQSIRLERRLGRSKLKTHHQHAESRLGVDVARRPPVLLEDSLLNLVELNGSRRSKLLEGPLVIGVDHRLGVRTQSVELVLDALSLGGRQPGLVPVDVRVRAWSGADDLDWR
jgi:hypothetical protein